MQRRNSCDERFTFITRLRRLKSHHGHRDHGQISPQYWFNIAGCCNIRWPCTEVAPYRPLYDQMQARAPNVPLPADGPCTPLEMVRVPYNRPQSTHVKFNCGMEKLTKEFFPTSTKGGVGNTYRVLYGPKTPAELSPFDGRKALRPRSKPCLAT